MLRYYKQKTSKGAQLFRKYLKLIYVDALRHSACENENEVIHYVWKKLTKTKKGKKENLVNQVVIRIILLVFILSWQ